MYSETSTSIQKTKSLGYWDIPNLGSNIEILSFAYLENTSFKHTSIVGKRNSNPSSFNRFEIT